MYVIAGAACRNVMYVCYGSVFEGALHNWHQPIIYHLIVREAQSGVKGMGKEHTIKIFCNLITIEVN